MLSRHKVLALQLVAVRRRRALGAEVRQALKDRQREIERANELEERSGERKRKFDVDACREKRAQAEAQVLLDEKRAAQDEILRLTFERVRHGAH